MTVAQANGHGAVRSRRQGADGPPPERTRSEETLSTSVISSNDATPNKHVKTITETPNRTTVAEGDETSERLFYSIKYKPRVSHLDPASGYQDYSGFFVLFWISLVIMVIAAVIRNVRETGRPLRVHWSLLFANVWQLASVDFLMVASTTVVLPMHRQFKSSHGWLRWSRWGIVIQSLYQIVWLVVWVALPFYLGWTWTAQVCLILHTLTILMKMHSYGFYNGHLSEMLHRLELLDKSRPEEPLPALVRYPRSLNRHGAQTPDTPDHSDDEQDGKNINKLRKALAVELTSPLGHVIYPANLSLANYIYFLLCPTLCYELEYPRTERIQWGRFSLLATAVFGCIFLMTLTSAEYIVPVLDDSAARMQTATLPKERALILFETINMLLFPFLISLLLSFLVIFEYILNAFAELTRFADRRFYSDWWNSCDWLEFSRKWNIPVHHFLRRHVYFSSLTHFSTAHAMAITFFVSSVAHELVMGCITKKLRGYGLLTQMLQLPIVAIQRSKYVRSRRVLNNACFWSQMITGLSTMCALYVLL